MTSFDPRELRNAFGSFMTGVTVVTAVGEEDAPIGFTANSFTSVSLDPPLVLVCLANTSRNYEALTAAKGFAVNVLAENQVELSNTFARPVDDRFANTDWSFGPFGSPVFAGVSAWFDCSMFKTVDAGDHVILIGRVEAFDSSPQPGLGYARGAYVTPAAEAEALRGSTDLYVSALIEHNGKVLLQSADDGGLSLPQIKVGKDGAQAALARLIETTGAAAEPGFIYSVYEDDTQSTQHISFLCQTTGEFASAGQFEELTPNVSQKIANYAERTMLERFGAEHSIGHFGVYCGTQSNGNVQPMASGS
ncbi:flavin reductase [Phaeobacter sp.]|uniref:flavin reductase n=1 Tax=Phaeobacter sp. TaxID=1902409 RepID=UPI0025F65E04|nr:flavin reductase family protein [Phaeobacter sp.]